MVRFIEIILAKFLEFMISTGFKVREKDVLRNKLIIRML